jgi:PAS domain S-box-containing protein
MSFEQNELLLNKIKNRQEEIEQLSKYLSQLESQLSLIFAASPDLMVVSEITGKIIKVNNAARCILGYTPYELENKYIWDFIHPDDVQKTKIIRDQVLRDNIFFNDSRKYFVNRWLKKNGEYAKLAWKFSFFDQEKGYMIKFATDISTFELENPHALNLINQVVKNSRDGIVITDCLRHNFIIYCNDAFLKATGYTSAELYNKNCRILQDRSEKQEAVKTIRECVSNGKRCEVLLKNKTKNGLTFFNHLIISPVYENNVLTNFIGISRDVTKEVNAGYVLWDPSSSSGFKGYNPEII